MDIFDKLSWWQQKRDRVVNPRGPSGPWVHHTTVFPDGTEVTWIFKSIHSDYSFRRAHVSAFRQPHNKGVSTPGRRPDSFNREDKLMAFRKNDKVPTGWPFSRGARKFFRRKQARQDRFKVKKQIKRAINTNNFDKIDDYVKPRDTWMWD